MTTPIHQQRKGQLRRRTPRFQLDWQNRDSNNTYRSPAMRVIAHQVPRQIRSLFDWVVRRDGRTQDIGARFKELAYMKLDVPEPEEWWAVQALGRGGFGAVMMFEKYNNDTGAVLDQIVVKTTLARPGLSAAAGDIVLSKEAAVMAQTNSTHLDGFVVLRGFKTVFPTARNAGVPGAFDGVHPPHAASDGDDDDDNGAQANRIQYTWRYYLELCEHGDLERLRIKYKAYGRYLPEPFLWHLFYWLAQSLERYAEGMDNNGDEDVPSFREMDVEHWGEQMDCGFLLHNDIKPMNIFLGSTDGPQPWAFYPIPRIGDLGLADITQGHDASTRAYNMRKGTAAYMTPEQRYDELDRETTFYPFGDLPGRNVEPRRYRKAFHHITSAANVAAIGMVMFQMMTLHEHDFLHDRIGQILREEINPGRNYAARNMCIIRMSDMRVQADGPGIRTKYSDDLRLMIMRCLMMNPVDRVSEQDLKTYCYAHYQRSIFELPGGNDNQANVERNARVYFAKNDIHTAPLNPGEIRYRFPDWRHTQWWRDIFWRDLMWQQESWGWDRPHDMPDQNDVGMPRWPPNLRPYMVATHTPPPVREPSHDEITPTPPPPRVQRPPPPPPRPAPPPQAQRPVPAPPGPPTPRPQPAVPRPAPLWTRPAIVGGWPNWSAIAGRIIHDPPVGVAGNQPESSGGDIPYRGPGPVPPQRPQRSPPAQQPFNHDNIDVNSEEAETDHLGDPGQSQVQAQVSFHDGLTPLRGGANLPSIPEDRTGTTSLAHNLRDLLGNRRGDAIRRRGAARRESARPGAAVRSSSVFNAFGLDVPVLTPGARPGPVRTTQRSSRFDPLGGRGSNANAQRPLTDRSVRRGGGVGGWRPINRQN